jgi:hypothetical protein
MAGGRKRLLCAPGDLFTVILKCSFNAVIFIISIHIRSVRFKFWQNFAKRSGDR